VNNAGDAGAGILTGTTGLGDLRFCIQGANDNTLNTGGVNTINFHIATSGTVQTIHLLSPLPVVTGTVTINATTESGFHNGSRLTVVLDGSSAGATDGLVMAPGGAKGDFVRGLCIQGFQFNGITLEGAGNTSVQSCFIGTDPTGTFAVPNGASGIAVLGNFNSIGGDAPHRNVISGNGASGIVFSGGSFNKAIGNFIGTDAHGTSALGNAADGVFVLNNAQSNQVGLKNLGNVISSNAGRGIEIDNDPSAPITATVVQANRIGTDVTGTLSLGNHLDGIFISASNLNLVGGTSAGTGNVIANNGGHGIFLDGDVNKILGNLIGTNAAGSAAMGNGQDGIVVLGSRNVIGKGVANQQNVISANGTNGVEVTGPNATHNLVQGNLIGTDSSGTLALGNTGAGVFVGNGAGANTIGGTTADGGRNLISGNQGAGVDLESSPTNLVEGNFIGTNLSGNAALGNQNHGVLVNSTSDTIGGRGAGAGNLVSGNASDQVTLNGDGNVLLGNEIGTNAAGTAALGGGFSGVAVFSSHNVIGGAQAGSRNLISGNSASGAVIDGAVDHNLVAGNFIGTDIGGTTAVGNAVDGVFLLNGANHNTISGNLLSGNTGRGLEIDSPANVVQGNLIGTDVSGNNPLGNQNNGVVVAGDSNTIGGTAQGAGNVISGNALGGLAIAGNKNVVQGNFIGTDKSGTLQLGNGQNGVRIRKIDTFQASHNTVGGTAAGAGNIIAFNGQDGVLVDGGTNDAIFENSVFSNTGPGIELINHGNHDQAAPVLSSAVTTGSDITIQGTLHSKPNTQFRLEFFANSTSDDEGQTFLGFQLVTTDGTGNVSFTADFASSVSAGQFITATATTASGHDTSEFSEGIPAGSPTMPTPENETAGVQGVAPLPKAKWLPEHPCAAPSAHVGSVDVGYRITLSRARKPGSGVAGAADAFDGLAG
jgi:titin